MAKQSLTVLLCIALLTSGALLNGCQPDTPQERIEENMEDAKENMEDAAEDVGEAVKDAGDAVEEKMNQ
jgi:predicted small secreted protein